MRNRWTREEAWEWYNSQPYINGCNFIPANVGRGDYYDPSVHEEAKKKIEVEVKLAADLGINSFRGIQLPPMQMWKDDRDLAMQYLDEYLDMLDRYGINVMPVLGSDCLPSKPDENGNRISCFDGKPVVGWMPEDDMNMWEQREAYVWDLATRYRDDRRIYMWNVWNEAGNSNRNREMLSLPFINRLFYLLRKAEVTQPLTADCYGLYNQIEGRYNFEVGLDPIERAVCNLSDIITFHYYGDLLHTKKYFKFLQEEFGRPMLNTEWGHRPWGSFIPSHLPLFKKYNIGSYFFGFVVNQETDGFRLDKVWPFIADDDRIDTSLWMHGIYRSDYTPYDQDDIDALLEMKAILEKERAEKNGVSGSRRPSKTTGGKK